MEGIAVYDGSVCRKGHYVESVTYPVIDLYKAYWKFDNDLTDEGYWGFDLDVSAYSKSISYVDTSSGKGVKFGNHICNFWEYSRYYWTITRCWWHYVYLNQSDPSLCTTFNEDRWSVTGWADMPDDICYGTGAWEGDVLPIEQTLFKTSRRYESGGYFSTCGGTDASSYIEVSIVPTATTATPSNQRDRYKMRLYAISNGVLQMDYTTTEVYENEWVQFGVTYDSSVLSFYVNGELENDASVTSNTFNGDIIMLGCDGVNRRRMTTPYYPTQANNLATGRFGGTLDQLRIFDVRVGKYAMKHMYENFL